MLNRRLVVLFILFVAGFCALAFRLAHLQITQAEHWQEEMRLSQHHPALIETARGAILDRNNIPLAFDKPSYYLAMDYRAMNHDDRWLARLASDRLKQQGFKDRVERSRRIPETKLRIAEEIDAIPAVIAQRCDTSELIEPSPDAAPVEKVLARFQSIRETIHNLRTQIWSQSGKPDDKSDAEFHRLLKDETLTHTIIPHISKEVAFYFSVHADEYPGLYVLDSRSRVYPYKDVACQVLGTLRGVDEKSKANSPFKYPDLRTDKDLGNLAGYRDEDRVGESGMEKVLEKDLHGSRGCRIVEFDLPGDDAAPAVDEEEAASPDRYIPPVFGKDGRLTLDISLQQDLEQALNDPARNFLKGKDGRDHFVAVVVLSVIDG